MSVIVGRALPDVRDGLKPVHRRVLYAMSQKWETTGTSPTRSPRASSARSSVSIHPARRDSRLRCASCGWPSAFSLRYDAGGRAGQLRLGRRRTRRRPCATPRFVCPASRTSLLADIDKETVDFGPNYDESEIQNPRSCPTRVPNLLVNGAAGIAVGMATNMPPHNLRRSRSMPAWPSWIDDESIGVPEFDATHAAARTSRRRASSTAPPVSARPTRPAAARCVRAGTGRRSRAAEKRQQPSVKIVVTELPYQVNKARLMEKHRRAGQEQAQGRGNL